MMAVIDDAVFRVDATDVTSYPGSGSVWSDLVASGDVTLNGGPALSGDFISFDGVNDAGIGPAFNSLLSTATGGTLASVIKFSVASHEDFSQCVGWEYNSSNRNFWIALSNAANGYQVRLLWVNASGSIGAINSPILAVSDVDPHMLVATYEYDVGTNTTTLTLFTDGEITGTATTSGQLRNSVRALDLAKAVTSSNVTKIDIGTIIIWYRAITESQAGLLWAEYAGQFGLPTAPVNAATLRRQSAQTIIRGAF